MYKILLFSVLTQRRGGLNLLTSINFFFILHDKVSFLRHGHIYFHIRYQIEIDIPRLSPITRDGADYKLMITITIML